MSYSTYLLAAVICLGILTAQKFFRKTKRYYNRAITVAALFTAAVLFLQHKGF